MSCGPATLRVGTDVQSIEEVADSLNRFGSRYTSRLFTDRELRASGGIAAPTAAASLAARFAAKEATIKVLRPEFDAPPWLSIEIRRKPGGWTELTLVGEAAELARKAGLGRFAVSLSHGAGVGVATVIAQTRRGDRMRSWTRQSVRYLLTTASSRLTH